MEQSDDQIPLPRNMQGFGKFSNVCLTFVQMFSKKYSISITSVELNTVANSKDSIDMVLELFSMDLQKNSLLATGKRMFAFIDRSSTRRVNCKQFPCKTMRGVSGKLKTENN
jgi:hypothetical protein